MLVIGIVGAKNSGKTTLVCKLVSKLVERGYSVSTVKHTHHLVEMDRPDTDSYRHRKAGASESVLASPKGLMLFREDNQEPELDSIVPRLSSVDILLVEGYKQHAYPKLLVHRAASAKKLVRQGIENVLAVLSDEPDNDYGEVSLDLNDIAQIAEFIIALIPSKK
jgi:molybdopterin-guanine dinucleotide biosynthesis protein B